MEAPPNPKRGASFEISDNEFPYGTSHKRCKQLVTSHDYVWHGRKINKAQLRTSLRRAQSAPLDRDNLYLETCSDLEHWRSREVERRPCPDRMARVQAEVTSAMRTTLVDWLGEVRDEFRLHSETLFLAVAYLDSFLAAKAVSRGVFQLLGLACVWVAAKFQEVHPPSLHCMLAMAEHMYSPDDLRAMEKEVLFTLDFGLAVPTSLRFLHYLLQLSPLPAHPLAATSVRRLAEALLELTLLDTAFLRLLPSQVASVAVYLALGLLRHPEGLRDVLELSEADPHMFGGLVQRLADTLREAADQPHPCALLLRFRAWEALHGGQAAVPPGDVPAAVAATAAPGGGAAADVAASAAEPVTPVGPGPLRGIAAANSAPCPVQVTVPSAAFATTSYDMMLQQQQQRISSSSQVATAASTATAAAARVPLEEVSGLDAALLPTAAHVAGLPHPASDLSAPLSAPLGHYQQHPELNWKEQQPPTTEPIWLLQLLPDEEADKPGLGPGPSPPVSLSPWAAGALAGLGGEGGGGGAHELSARWPLGDLDALGSLTLTAANAAAAAPAAMACG